MAADTDVIVIGAGPTGENVADYATRAGLRAVLVEEALIGGECSYYACMPSKALLRPGSVVAAARRVAGAAEAVTGALSVPAVFARRDAFTSRGDDAGQVEWATSAGIAVVRGRGVISGTREVAVHLASGENQTLVAEHAVVVATGSRPRIPDVPGLDSVDYWTTPDATNASTVPESLAVWGGGVASVEIAQIYARWGSAVTIIVRGDILSMFPQQARDRVAAGLETDNVTILRGQTIERVNPSGQRGQPGAIVTLSNGEDMTVERLLVATGRVPNTDGIGLDARGITGFDPGDLIPTDDSGRVLGVEWLYADGDVVGPVPLTHQGKYQARVTGEAIAARARGEVAEYAPAWSRYASTADHTAIPQVVFTDPEVAHVGLMPESSDVAGRAVHVVEMPLAVAGASLHADGYDGWARLVIEDRPEGSVVVGADFVGQDVAEMLHAATIAIVGEVPLDRLWHAVPAYPTMSEIWLRLLERERFG